MTKQLIVAAWDGNKKITARSEAANFAAAGPIWSAMVAEGFASAFIVDCPLGFDVRTWKVNTAGNGVEVDQGVIDADNAAAAAAAAEKARVDAFAADAGCLDTLDKIATLTFAQFDAWFDANVTTLAQARAALKRLCWVVILLVKRRL